jgi:hypothetical protein
MAKKKAADGSKSNKKLTEKQIATHQLRSAEHAARSGWYLVTDPSNYLFAVNPHDSSEVWTYYAQLLVWRRKGEEETSFLRMV